MTVIDVEKAKKTTAPPKLLDLTSLQREVQRLLGYTAQQTLDYLQNLYERRLTTYPSYSVVGITWAMPKRKYSE